MFLAPSFSMKMQKNFHGNPSSQPNMKAKNLGQRNPAFAQGFSLL
jgi:hypothetical protein